MQDSIIYWHRSRSLLTVLATAVTLCGCDFVANKAGAGYMKVVLQGACAEEQACLKAIDEQFWPCHEKYQDDWNRLLDSSSSDEDELSDIYTDKLLSCFLDENGEPFFDLKIEQTD